jgi:hypothetical protein
MILTDASLALIQSHIHFLDAVTFPNQSSHYYKDAANVAFHLMPMAGHHYFSGAGCTGTPFRQMISFALAMPKLKIAVGSTKLHLSTDSIVKMFVVKSFLNDFKISRLTMNSIFTRH